MARIYDKAGNKMNVAGIVQELQDTITEEQKKVLAEAIAKYEGIFNNSQMLLAHGILDTYRHIESTSEQGQRVRKLMDNLMTKYQKSQPANADDQAVYHSFLGSLK